MPRFVRNPRGSFHAETAPKVRGKRLLGEIRSLPYSEMRRVREAKRLRKKASKIQKRLEKRKSGSWSVWAFRKKRSRKGQISRIKGLARKLNPPRRPGPPKPNRPQPLIKRLIDMQNIGEEWVGVVKRMEKEGLLTITEKTNLRQEIANIIRPITSGAARHFENGGSLYLQKGNQPLATILKNARTKPAFRELIEGTDKEKRTKARV